MGAVGMGGIFGHDYQTYPFVFFSFDHLLVLIVFGILTFLLYKYRVHLRRLDTMIRATFFVLLFGMELLYHIWLYRGGFWDVSFTLPLQLCSISLILSLILLLTNSRWLASVLYFIGVIGAFAALLTPELFLGFPHFRYFQFFITHMLIIWTALYYVWVHHFYPNKRSIWYALIFLNSCAFIAFWVNRISGGNYMFLAEKPVNASLMDYLGPYPFYIVSLEGLALGLFWILWLPFSKKEKVSSNLKEKG
jgi:hypothetical integral membrane protein (TIGR02206 family)